MKNHKALNWIEKKCVFPPQAGRGLAGKPCGKFLLPFQKNILKTIFNQDGSIGKDVFIFGCRKISKSLLYSWSVFFLLCDPQHIGFEIPVVSSVFNQGLILHRQIESQINSVDNIKKQFKVRKDYFLNTKTHSKAHVVYNATESNLGLQSSAAVFDELGAFKDDSILSVIQTGQSLSTERPLNLYASNPPEQPHHFSIALLKALERDQDTKVFKFVLDPKEDWESPDAWAKVNPFIHAYKKKKLQRFRGVFDYYKKEFEKVKVSDRPETELAFRKYLLGQTLSKTASEFISDSQLKTIPEAQADTVLNDNSLRFAVSLDLSDTYDFTAVNFIFFNESSEKIFFIPALFLPKLSESRHSTQKRIFQKWADAGFIIIQNKQATDKHQIVSAIKNFVTDIGRSPEAIVFEQAGSSGWISDFAEFRTAVVRYRPFDMTEAVNKIQRVATLGNLFMIGENPCVKWQLSNCIVSERSKNYRLINRESARASIDVRASLSIGMKYFVDNKKRILKPFYV